MVKPAVFYPECKKGAQSSGWNRPGLGGIEWHTASPVTYTHATWVTWLSAYWTWELPCTLTPACVRCDKTQSQAFIPEKGKTRKPLGGNWQEQRWKKEEPRFPFLKNPSMLMGNIHNPKQGKSQYVTLIFLLLKISYMGPMLMFIPPANLQNSNLISSCTC